MILVDTSIIIYAASDPSKLSPRAVEVLSNNQTVKYMSSVSVMEILHNISLKNLTLGIPPAEFIKGAADSLGLKPLAFNVHDAFAMEKLPDIHKDPFDRMLIGQVINNGVAMVTDDKDIAKYPIRVIW